MSAQGAEPKVCCHAGTTTERPPNVTMMGTQMVIWISDKKRNSANAADANDERNADRNAVTHEPLRDRDREHDRQATSENPDRGCRGTTPRWTREGGTDKGVMLFCWIASFLV